MNTSCMIDFLSDVSQRKLRRLAQTQGDSYENTLEVYKKLFVSNYRFCINKSNECNEDNCPYKGLCDKIYLSIESIKIEDIESFFDTIKDSYIKWINSQLVDSLNILEKILEKYKLFEFKMRSIENDVYFKGRNEKDILTTWDMFHIPFNKRYLIKNQRYSITGQPLIYLGLSIIDVIEELEVGENELDYLKTSSYRLTSDLKIYDLRNNIYEELFDENLTSIFEVESMPKNESIINFEGIFFRNILSSICSFEKRKEHKGFHFCEEYVLPQMVAQILKKNDFDGIRYISTKKFKGLTTEKGDKFYSNINNMLYRENMALFTNINSKVSEVYDKELYSKITISRPLDMDRLDEIGLEDLNSVLEEIEFFKNKKLHSEVNVMYEKFKREFQNLSINNNSYLECDSGKMHINHIYILISSILQKCMESGEKIERDRS